MNMPINHKNQLIDMLTKGCKPKSEWKIGTEHEKFVYYKDDFSPVPYHGQDGRAGIIDILKEFETKGWKPIYEGETMIGLSDETGANISLEPAGQLELSGAPLKTVHETCNETGRHLRTVNDISKKLNVGFLGLGYQPFSAINDLPWMPKQRYDIMKNYMPQVGSLGLHMMKSTCTVQVNLDFDSEQTMVQMYRIALALQPMATALWANSPFRMGRPSGYLSYRARIWQDTDPDRTGMLPFVFDDSFGFERYVDYLLDMPMYFIYRDKQYINATGDTFRSFLAGTHKKLKGYAPCMKDFDDHMTTAFPEVRLKTYLEMRGSDGSSWNRICALPAFWVGILYDDQSRQAAYDIIKDWCFDELRILRDGVAKFALKTPFRGRALQEHGLQFLKLAHNGLARRENLGAASGLDETSHLRPLIITAESGVSPAESLLYAYEHFWDRNIFRIYKEYAL